MTAAGWGQLIALVVVIGVTAPLLGRYMANVLQGAPSRLDRAFGPIERRIYRACRVDPEREQRWNVYALSVLAFSLVSFFVLYLIERIQGDLPFNPNDIVNVHPALAMNTAVSFVTNTNWQSYAPETPSTRHSVATGWMARFSLTNSNPWTGSRSSPERTRLLLLTGSPARA